MNALGIVAKVYDSDHCTRRRYEKIRQMIVSSLKFSGICFPTGILYNSRKEFTGYIMQKVMGNNLNISSV